MRALKTGLWLLLVAGLFAFTYGNPETIAVHIWPGLIWETRAPALVIGALLVGFVPCWLIHRATRWRLSRRIATLEATLAAQAQAAGQALATSQAHAETEDPK
jgi:lipopolysaccharide assembly protein A